MRIVLDEEAVERMKATMGDRGFQRWIEKIKRQGNEVVIEGSKKHG